MHFQRTYWNWSCVQKFTTAELLNVPSPECTLWIHLLCKSIIHDYSRESPVMWCYSCIVQCTKVMNLHPEKPYTDHARTCTQEMTMLTIPYGVWTLHCWNHMLYPSNVISWSLWSRAYSLALKYVWTLQDWAQKLNDNLRNLQRSAYVQIGVTSKHVSST